MTRDIPYNEHFGDKKEDIGPKTPIFCKYSVIP